MPAKPPFEQVIERSTDTALNDRAVMGITRPRLAVFVRFIPNGAAVAITPGGGYKRVVMDKEGYIRAAGWRHAALPCSCCSTACLAMAGPLAPMWH